MLYIFFKLVQISWFLFNTFCHIFVLFLFLIARVYVCTYRSCVTLSVWISSPSGFSSHVCYVKTSTFVAAQWLPSDSWRHDFMSEHLRQNSEANMDSLRQHGLANWGNATLKNFWPLWKFFLNPPLVGTKFIYWCIENDLLNTM